jgi:hypothetical protein
MTIEAPRPIMMNVFHIRMRCILAILERTVTW